MKLTTYIELYYAGNKTAFATAMGVHAPQVHQWITADAEVIGGKLVTVSRPIPAPDMPRADVYEDFERTVTALNKAIPLDKDEKGYTDKFVRGAFAMFSMMDDIQPAKVKEIRDDVMNQLHIATEALDKIRLAVKPDADGYF